MALLAARKFAQLLKRLIHFLLVLLTLLRVGLLIGVLLCVGLLVRLIVLSVRFRRLGRVVLRVVEGLEPGGIVTVRFAGDGSERKLMLDYAPLEKIA